MQVIASKEQAQKFINEAFADVEQNSRNILLVLFDPSKRPTDAEMDSLLCRAVEVNAEYEIIESVADTWGLETPTFAIYI